LFRSFVISLAMVVALLASLPFAASAHPRATPTPTPTPTPPPEDPAITAIARREFVAWQAGVVDKSRYSAAMQAVLTDDQIARTSKNLSAVGALERTQWLGPYPGPPATAGARSYLFHMFCSVQAVYELLTISPDGKIAGIGFRDTL
jgi:hypothetical protein